ncbi:hypothetical protein QQF64_034237 [Cirrhinus molitorella]|uniref:Uncharacterized protein n=1 Tax=Cirrhinus molitorella TaxID=172907 RepID=A0ABR3MW89_9TELE
MKKNLFLLGKDIWNKDESRAVHSKKKMLDSNNEVEAKKARLSKLPLSHRKSTSSSAGDGSELMEDDAVSLMSSVPEASALLGSTQEEQEMSEGEEAEAEHSQSSCPAYEELLEVKEAKTKKAARPLALTSDHHISSDEATNIASPFCPDHHTGSDDATSIGSSEMIQDANTGPKMLSPMNEDIMTSLRGIQVGIGGIDITVKSPTVGMTALNISNSIPVKLTSF